MPGKGSNAEVPARFRPACGFAAAEARFRQLANGNSGCGESRTAARVAENNLVRGRGGSFAGRRLRRCARASGDIGKRNYSHEGKSDDRGAAPSEPYQRPGKRILWRWNGGRDQHEAFPDSVAGGGALLHDFTAEDRAKAAQGDCGGFAGPLPGGRQREESWTTGEGEREAVRCGFGSQVWADDFVGEM